MEMLAALNVARGARLLGAMHRRREESREPIFGIITVEKPIVVGIPFALYVVGSIDVRCAQKMPFSRRR
jgi:hypothetical protein